MSQSFEEKANLLTVDNFPDHSLWNVNQELIDFISSNNQKNMIHTWYGLRKKLDLLKSDSEGVKAFYSTVSKVCEILNHTSKEDIAIIAQKMLDRLLIDIL